MAAAVVEKVMVEAIPKRVLWAGPWAGRLLDLNLNQDQNRARRVKAAPSACSQ